MEWRDEGIVLSVRVHAESAVITNILTRSHGRHAGLVRGGAGRRARGMLQPGNEVAVAWRGRLAEHLGAYSCELNRSCPAYVFNDPFRLAGLSSTCALSDVSIPEREPLSEVYSGVVDLLHSIGETDRWPADYVRWEISLLRHLGYGLDLSRCAVTGSREGLAYVSPVSGRAVVASVAEPYRKRLFRLPSFVLEGRHTWEGSQDDILAGLSLTGHFLERHVLGPQNIELPQARLRLVDRFYRNSIISSGTVAL